MKPELVKKAASLLEEIKELKKYKNLIEDKKQGSTAHFEFVQHYGNLSDYERVQIEIKHSDRFISLLDTIITELEKELEEI